MKSDYKKESQKKVLNRIVKDNTKQLANNQYYIGLYFGNIASCKVLEDKFSQKQITKLDKNYKSKIQELSETQKKDLLIDIFEFAIKTININQKDYLNELINNNN